MARTRLSAELRRCQWISEGGRIGSNMKRTSRPISLSGRISAKKRRIQPQSTHGKGISNETRLFTADSFKSSATLSRRGRKKTPYISQSLSLENPHSITWKSRKTSNEPECTRDVLWRAWRTSNKAQNEKETILLEFVQNDPERTQHYKSETLKKNKEVYNRDKADCEKFYSEREQEILDAMKRSFTADGLPAFKEALDMFETVETLKDGSSILQAKNGSKFLVRKARSEDESEPSRMNP